MAAVALPASCALIGRFLKRIGITLERGTLSSATFLPGVEIRAGRLVYDPLALLHPGDLLHEAGHVAVTDPRHRADLSTVADDPGEEMAAIAWSWAAAVEIGLAPDILFHAGGYRGGAQALISNFQNGHTVGVPLLAAWDMTSEPHRAAAEGYCPFPHMRRWLR